jgi:peptidase S46-like protein
MKRLAACCLAALLPLAARADEGMWTYDNFPSAKVAKKYGFAPDAKWLTEAQLSSVRLAGGCSGSFVSPDGLVMTNHHCAHSCIEQLSTKEKDFVKEGFYAPALEQEVKCPEIELNQLVQIADVTKRMNAATQGLDGQKFAEAQRAEMAKIEKECAGDSDKLRCDVVTLYHGGIYDLYKYRRFQDVRLVFAPELAIAFFGGDPDNFNFPRYDLDVSFIRAYENGKPARTEHHFKWSPAGAKEGDLAFVSGHPGGTDRELTVAQLKYQRDIALPESLFALAEYRGALTMYTRLGAEQHRTAEAELFGIENSYKAVKGRYQALITDTLWNEKAQREQKLRATVKKSPAMQKQYGAAWDMVAKAVEEFSPRRKEYQYIEGASPTRPSGFRSRYFAIAKTLVRAADELPKPNEQRLRELRDSNLPAVKQGLFSQAPIYDEFETFRLSYSLVKLREELGADHPFVRKVLGKKSPEELAKELIAGTKLKDVELRKKLWDGGKAAVSASDDAFIQLVRLADPDARAVRRWHDDVIEPPEKKGAELIAKAKFQIEGTSNYPDATFTLRLSYGSVEGYEDKGRRVNPITVIGGAFERATGRDPFALPKSWLVANQDKRINLATPFDMATSNDIIGGNSGSPVFNKNLEIVGLIFDGNIQSLGGNYGFDPSVNRAISVCSPALLEALDHVYGAKRIVAELRSGAPQSGGR